MGMACIEVPDGAGGVFRVPVHRAELRSGAGGGYEVWDAEAGTVAAFRYAAGEAEAQEALIHALIDGLMAGGDRRRAALRAGGRPGSSPPSPRP